MKLIKITKEQWTRGLKTAFDTYRLFGPTAEKDFHGFKALDKGELPDFSFANTRISPKALLFPQSENILEYHLDESKEDHHIMKEVEKDDSPRAVIGLRPCDAKAVTLVKLNYDTPEYQDPYWLKAYETTTFVGLACDEPLSTCFCTTAGCGPYHEEGLDILLVKDNDALWAKILSEKGEKFLQTAGWNDAAKDSKLINSKKSAAEAKIVSTVATDNLKAQDTLSLHDASFWEDVSFACLNCGTCTFVCPTCWCFDIQDEVYGKKGVRMKNWDSCMFPLFTLHTTGHNPRGTKVQRVRQRFMHKLKYFVDKYESGIMCVGCGRCVRQCPVNIDVRRVCDLMNSYQPESADAAQC